MSKSIEEQYQKKTQHEHILSLPDMYIGSVERTTDEVWVFDESTEQMARRRLSWVPGLFKIFDEILVNAADNKIRDHEGQTLLSVDINREKGSVQVRNNGSGIPVEKHKKHNLWIPEMIFGHLMTSGNYQQGEVRVVGGRNGFGAKLTNVFSKKFVVETCHKGKKFSMTWTGNMLQPGEPELGTHHEDFTSITFWPDFERFGMASFEEDIVLLMTRRVYDIAGSTHSSMKVKLNGKVLPVRKFVDYVDLFPTLGEERNAASYARVNDRWEVCVRVSNIGFQQVSFVNSIVTSRGGNHVKYVTDQVLDKVIAAVKKKDKSLDPKAHMIKPHLWVFVNCLIENPSFDSQTKETLNTTKSRFGSDCPLPDSLINFILKSGVVERTIATANNKLTKEMQSKIKTADRSRITGIPKLEDANDAGTRQSADCTLILTEGDSAKALAVSGLSVVGRDKFGVFPLRGKPLNVRDSTLKKVNECEEIQAVMKIVGLRVGTTYDSVDGLRYGRIMIMADQDHDGSHIKGLIINFIHFFWPSLLKLDGFLTQFITPIVKAHPVRKGQPVLSFFSLPDFLAWKNSLSPADTRKYKKPKYYKGLGTSDASEARDYFRAFRDHRIRFTRSTDADTQRIEMAFAKARVDDRKQWITAYSADTHEGVDFRVKDMSYADFIDKELLLFSIADCERSIPSMMDGFKPGQRKIIYSCFKRNLINSLKVAQLAGYVSEHAAYHHGEASLAATIVNLAQDYMGSNNVPFLVPEGQFGTRLQGGKDHASARYIFTKLADTTRSVFLKCDDDILSYKDDDGAPVEPHFYTPVIPTVLLNGTSGIGTGFASTIPNFNPMDLIANMRRLLRGEDVQPMLPWYYGFSGTIEATATKGKFVSRGVHTVGPDGVIHVTELPVGTWTGAYKNFLEDLSEKGLVVAFRENHTDITVDFDIMLHPEAVRVWTDAGVLGEKLNLTSNINTTNIVCFDEAEKLTKYVDAEAVMKAFFLVRAGYYEKRRDHLMDELRLLCEKLRNMVRFVLEVVEGKFDVTKKKKKILLEELRAKGYKAFPPQSKKKLSSGAVDAAGDDGKDDEEDPTAMPQEDDVGLQQATKDYDYLLGMRIWALTKEMVERLQEQLRRSEGDFRTLEAKTSKDLWSEDLDALEAAIGKYFEARQKEAQYMLASKKAKRPFTAPRRTPVLTDGAKAGLVRDEEKSKPKEAKRPRAKRTKKDSDDDDFGFGDSDSDPPLGAESRKKAPAAKRSSQAKPKPSAKAPARKVRKVEDDDDDDDDLDLDDFGIEALAKDEPTAKPAPKKAAPKQAAPKKAAPKAAEKSVTIVDSDDELLLGESPVKAAPKPAKKPARKPAAKKAAPKGSRAKKARDSDSDDFIGTSSDSSDALSDSGSDDSSDDDFESDTDSDSE